MAEPPPALVDAHCHLDEVVRRGEPADRVLARARASGVLQVVSSGDGLEDSERARELAEQFEGVFFTAGWHPVRGALPGAGERRRLGRLLAHPKAVALGEVGLDYLLRPGYLETPPELQRRIFASMLELAAEAGKPVVVHQREAEADLLRVLDAGPRVAAVLHCFSGGPEFAREAAARGLYCSFAGNVTFKSASRLQAGAREVPSELLLVETDAPFLAPEPHRGRPSEPAMVRATAQWLAVLRGDCLRSLAGATTANARRAFGLPPA